MLIFGEDYFLQCLEGGRTAVNHRCNSIVADPHHERGMLLSYGEIDERSFAEWDMKLVLVTEKKAELLRRFSIRGRFDPYTMTGKSALALMLALR